MNITISSDAQNIINTLECAGFHAYITGSAVTEYLLGLPLSSIHIATSASPFAITSLFPDCSVINPQSKTVTILQNMTGFEISSFRTAPSTFAAKPDVYDELSLSSFTIDAIAFNQHDGFLDFFGGINDINQKKLRSLKAPDDLFFHAPGEMLRAVRLCSVYDFSLDDTVEKSIRKFSFYSKNIPRSIRLEEFNKMLLAPIPSKGFKMLHEFGLLKHLADSLDTCFYTEQKNKYHIYDVGTHIMYALDSSPPDLILRWAALLHDIGKPVCKSLDSAGIIHFYGHHRESMLLADELLNSLHLDRSIIQDILTLIEYHDVRIDASLPAIKRLLSKLGASMFLKLLSLQEADARAKNPDFIADKLEKLYAVRSLYQTIIEEGQPYKISDLAVNARDLMKLNYKVGRQINDTLKLLLDDVILNPSLNNYTYLLNKARKLKNEK